MTHVRRRNRLLFITKAVPTPDEGPVAYQIMTHDSASFDPTCANMCQHAPLNGTASPYSGRTPFMILLPDRFSSDDVTKGKAEVICL